MRSAWTTLRKVSLLVLSILLKSLTADRNQKNCNGSCPHSRSTATAQLVVDCFTPNLKRHENNTSCRCLVLLVASSQKHQLVFLPQYDDSPARLGMLLDRRINPKIAEEHAVRPYMAAQSRMSESAFNVSITKDCLHVNSTKFCC